MDVKALAKSKRAHSNHHSKKHHPQQSSKAPSISSDNNKKPTGRQAKGNPQQSLPTNWERYNENTDSFSEESQPSSNQLSEFVVTKSKGADYAHLISEAKDQSRSQYSSDGFPSLDEVINDFTQDFGPMLLAAKGQSMLSWVTDDDFEFEGGKNTNIEAPFLSLNLNALAGQLAKAKLSKRCFLDPDLFPLELLDDELQACDEEKDVLASSLGHNQDINKNAQQYQESSSTVVTLTRNIPVQTSKGESKPSKQDIVEILHSQEKNPPVFQATSAEAELDMLLSSFGETKITESTSELSSSLCMENPSMAATLGERHMTKMANLDDDIDKLLEETSYLTNIDSRGAQSEVKASTDAISSTLNHGSKSKLLDDFDSWLDTI